MTTTDKNVENVITQLRDREEQGMKKYGVNTERKDLSTLEWLQHLQEELMDAVLYIQTARDELQDLNEESLIEKFKDDRYEETFQ